MLRLPGKQMSFKDLKEEDRIFIIMAIRELTFSKGENNLVLKPVCKECNHENELKRSQQCLNIESRLQNLK